MLRDVGKEEARARLTIEDLVLHVLP